MIIYHSIAIWRGGGGKVKGQGGKVQRFKTMTDYTLLTSSIELHYKDEQKRREKSLYVHKSLLILEYSNINYSYLINLQV